MVNESEFLTTRYRDENLPAHWAVSSEDESFRRLIEHIGVSTNFKSFFEKEISYPPLFATPEKLVVADIGAGVGWTTALLALKPEVKKVYAIEPSTSRRSRIPTTCRHFHVPDSKIEVIDDGHFQNLNLPEKVNLIVFSSSFHHCFDSQMDDLFEQIRMYLAPQLKSTYVKHTGERVEVGYKSKVLLASEHYVNWIYTSRQVLRFFAGKLSSTFEKQAGYPEKFGQWRPPDQWGGEHWRTRREIERIVSQNSFSAKFVQHQGNAAVGPRHDKRNRSLVYYFCILEDTLT